MSLNVLVATEFRVCHRTFNTSKVTEGTLGYFSKAGDGRERSHKRKLCAHQGSSLSYFSTPGCAYVSVTTRGVTGPVCQSPACYLEWTTRGLPTGLGARYLLPQAPPAFPGPNALILNPLPASTLETQANRGHLLGPVQTGRGSFCSMMPSLNICHPHFLSSPNRHSRKPTRSC